MICFLIFFPVSKVSNILFEAIEYIINILNNAFGTSIAFRKCVGLLDVVLNFDHRGMDLDGFVVKFQGGEHVLYLLKLGGVLCFVLEQ